MRDDEFRPLDVIVIFAVALVALLAVTEPTPRILGPDHHVHGLRLRVAVLETRLEIVETIAIDALESSAAGRRADRRTLELCESYQVLLRVLPGRARLPGPPGEWCPLPEVGAFRGSILDKE